jgi:uncharacterized membrane protein
MNAEQSGEGERYWRWFVAANVVALFTVAGIFRIWRIGHVPGLNGDEAWLGVQALRWLSGERVAWFTPTGNPINVFHFLPQAFWHWIAEPSVPLLRLTVLISGALVLPVNYVLCRRVFGRRTAAISTVLLAVLPINIAYSRFAWDASQSVLFTLPVVFASLLLVREAERPVRWLLFSLLALAAAVVVHPTNIFNAPVIAVAAAFRFRHKTVPTLHEMKSRWRPRLVCASALLGSVAVAGLVESKLAVAAQRAVTPSQYVLFVRRYADLFSGTTIYRYVTGAQLDDSLLDVRLYRLAASIVLALAMIAIVQRLRRGTSTAEEVLIAGCLVSAFGFFLVAGPEAADIDTQRYAMCLIGPGAVLFGLAGDWWIERFRRPAVCGGLLLAWLLIWSFHTNYLRPFEQSGGEAHRTFRTAAIEPKLAAAAYVSREAGGEPRWIVATEWWTYWPLAYLLHGHDEARVLGSAAGDVPFGEDRRAEFPFLSEVAAGRLNDTARSDPLAVGRVYFVEFHGSHRTRAVESQLAAHGYALREAIVRDAEGRPLLTIVQPHKP